jgi:hypothetical protein
MSERHYIEDISDILQEVNGNWRHGPLDRQVTQIGGIIYRDHSPSHRWKVLIDIDGDTDTPTVMLEEDSHKPLVLYGSSQRLAGQVQRWSRRIALLTVIISSTKFRELSSEFSGQLSNQQS